MSSANRGRTGPVLSDRSRSGATRISLGTQSSFMIPLGSKHHEANLPVRGGMNFGIQSTLCQDETSSTRMSCKKGREGTTNHANCTNNLVKNLNSLNNVYIFLVRLFALFV